MKLITLMNLPIKIVSEANKCEHWTKKHKRHKSQKLEIWAAFTNFSDPVPLPCLIRLTRVAPRFLDSEDNLPMGLKYVKDYIADQVLPGQAPGRADSDPRIKWEYDQERGKPKEYALKIEVFIPYSSRDCPDA